MEICFMWSTQIYTFTQGADVRLYEKNVFSLKSGKITKKRAFTIYYVGQISVLIGFRGVCAKTQSQSLIENKDTCCLHVN